MIPVVVFDIENDKKIMGLGTCRFEDVNVMDDNDETKLLYTLPDHPVITMEQTGDIICGIECWWIPISDFITANQQVLRAFGGTL